MIGPRGLSIFLPSMNLTYCRPSSWSRERPRRRKSDVCRPRRQSRRCPGPPVPEHLLQMVLKRDVFGIGIGLGIVKPGDRADYLFGEFGSNEWLGFAAAEQLDACF